jgi:hypothetical protein
VIVLCDSAFFFVSQQVVPVVQLMRHPDIAVSV